MSATVLLVDADQFFLRLYGETLVRAGYRVSTCANVREFEALLATLPAIDVALVELGMSAGRGVEWAGQLGRLEGEPIVVGIGTPADARLMGQASRVGVLDFLPKPIETEFLLQLTERLLARKTLESDARRLVNENLFQLEVQRIFKDGLYALRTLDEEALFERLLELAQSHTRSQGVVLYAYRNQVLKRVGYRGLVDEEALPLELDPAQTLPVGSGHSPVPIDQPLRLGGTQRVKATSPEQARGLLLPIFQDQHLEGLLVALARVGHPWQAGDLIRATLFCEIAATALGNARRYASERRSAVHAPTGKAASIRFFVDFLGKELHKARRYHRQFAILDVRCEALPKLITTLGEERGQKLAQAISGRLEALLRDADMLARAGADQYLVLLPETDLFGARATLGRIEEALAAEPLLEEAEKPMPLGLVTGCTCFPHDGADIDALIATLKRRVDEARQSPYLRLGLAERDFVAAGCALLEEESPLRANGGQADYAFTHMSAAESLAIVRELLLSRAGLPAQRFSLYFGAQELTPAMVAEISSLVPAEWINLPPRVFLFGSMGAALSPPPTLVVVAVERELASRLGFVIAFNELGAYALLGPSLHSKESAAFHSSDYPLALGLARKLHKERQLRKLL